MDDDSVHSRRNDDHSPAPATFLQQLHLLLHRTVQTHSYSHDPKQLEAKRDTGTKKPFSGGGYQLSLRHSTIRLRSDKPTGCARTKLPRLFILSWPNPREKIPRSTLTSISNPPSSRRPKLDKGTWLCSKLKDG